MDSEILGKRRRALEEAFFQKENEELVEKLRSEKEAAETKEALRDLTGIRDDAVIDALKSRGVTPASLAAFRLVPLVHVAWADGVLEEKERKAILSAAEEAGIESGSPSHALLDQWLAKKPSSQLFEAWTSYARALAEGLEAGARRVVHDDVLDLVTEVARAAGGILGVGSVSASEKQAIADVEKALDA